MLLLLMYVLSCLAIILSIVLDMKERLDMIVSCSYSSYLLLPLLDPQINIKFINKNKYCNALS